MEEIVGVVVEEIDVFTLYNVCSVHRGDTMSRSGDIMSTSGGYYEYIGGVQYIGGVP